MTTEKDGKMNAKKVIMLGALGSGKTTALENFCSKLMQNSTMEHGIANINQEEIHFLSSPKGKQLDFMEEILSKTEVNGAAVFVDNTMGVTGEDKKIIKTLERKGIPNIILSNKSDLNKNKMDMDFTSAPVVPVVAKNGSSVTKAIEKLLKLISPHQYYLNKKAQEVVTIKSRPVTIKSRSFC